MSEEAAALIAIMDESAAVRDQIIEMSQRISREATALEARLEAAEGLLRRVASGEETAVIRTSLLEKIHLFLGEKR